MFICPTVLKEPITEQNDKNYISNNYNNTHEIKLMLNDTHPNFYLQN
jgi:hypothetical protein